MKELKDVLEQIEKSKKIIAEQRDFLRGIYDTLEEIIESCDQSIDGFDNGKREIEAAIDSVSQYL